MLDVDASNDIANPAAYTVTDADADDEAAALKWTLSGADASKFDITPDTDDYAYALAFRAKHPTTSLPGDSGGNNVYEVTVVVTDSKGNTDEQEVTVKVTNMEEDGEDRPCRPCSLGLASR